MARTRIIARLAAVVGTALAVVARGELKVPRFTDWVVDQAGVLSASDQAVLAERLRALEQATGGQMAVLIIPSLGDDSLELFSMRVAETWKVGRKGEDTGALLLIARDDRMARLEIGKGWEGQINDARAGDTIRGMGPFLRQGQYAQAVAFAISDVHEYVTGQRPTGAKAAPRQTTRSRQAPPGVVLAFIILFILLSALGGRRRFGFGPVIFMGGSSRGGFGGGWGSGGGGFSGGGGGSFGGGGASGSW